MSIERVAYASLYDDVESYTFKLQYSGHFNAYNANIRYHPHKKLFEFSLSKKWKHVDHDIVIGLLQSLILRMKKDKKRTLNIELYEGFLKQVDKYTKVHTKDPYLKEVFDRVNEKYFSNNLEYCNLKWGQHSIRTLGHYTFGSDTITISTLFRDIDDVDMPYLDFVMYHEMLHKKHKFEGGAKAKYHTKAFRHEEKQFDNFEHLDKTFPQFIRKYNRRYVYRMNKQAKDAEEIESYVHAKERGKRPINKKQKSFRNFFFD
ncbi:MAG: hypothetical protein ACMXYK_01010 [Candidatus Woesearchaeota archaeon]